MSNNWADVLNVDPEIVASLQDVFLIKLEGTLKVYKLEDDKKRWIKTAEAFARLNFDWNLIAPVNQTELDSYTEESAIE